MDWFHIIAGVIGLSAGSALTFTFVRRDVNLRGQSSYQEHPTNFHGVPHDDYYDLRLQRDRLGNTLSWIRPLGLIGWLTAGAAILVLVVMIQTKPTDTSIVAQTSSPLPTAPLHDPLSAYVATDCIDDGTPSRGPSGTPVVLSRITCKFGDLTLYAHRYASGDRDKAEPHQSEKSAPAGGGCPGGFRILAEHLRWSRHVRQGYFTEFLQFRTGEQHKCIVDSKIWLVDDQEPDIALVLFGRLSGSPEQPDLERLRNVIRLLGYQVSGDVHQ